MRVPSRTLLLVSAVLGLARGHVTAQETPATGIFSGPGDVKAVAPGTGW